MMRTDKKEDFLMGKEKGGKGLARSHGQHTNIRLTNGYSHKQVANLTALDDQRRSECVPKSRAYERVARLQF